MLTLFQRPIVREVGAELPYSLREIPPYRGHSSVHGGGNDRGGVESDPEDDPADRRIKFARQGKKFILPAAPLPEAAAIRLSAIAQCSGDAEYAALAAENRARIAKLQAQEAHSANIKHQILQRELAS